MATTRRPAATAERMPLAESSIATAAAGSTPSRRVASRYTSGDGLPRATSSELTVAVKRPRTPRASSTTSTTSRFDDVASPSGQRAPRRSTAWRAPASAGSARA
jgi:hypothetical protein